MRIDKNTNKHVSIKCHRHSIGVGYIVVPSGVDRDLFVSKCIRTNRVSLYTHNGDYSDRVPVSGQTIQSIDFPNEPGELGSAVLFVVVPKKNKPVVICTLLSHEESMISSEGEFYLEKKTESGVARIGGSNVDGVINIVSNFKDVSKVNLVSFSEDAEINIRTNGDVNVEAEENILIKSYNKVEILVSNIDTGGESKITYEKGYGFTYEDEFENKIEANSSGITISSDKILIGSENSTEPSVLGQTFSTEILKTQALLAALKNSIQSAPVVPNDGGASFKAAISSAISSLETGNFANILSTKSYME